MSAYFWNWQFTDKTAGTLDGCFTVGARVRDPQQRDLPTESPAFDTCARLVCPWFVGRAKTKNYETNPPINRH